MLVKIQEIQWSPPGKLTAHILPVVVRTDILIQTRRKKENGQRFDRSMDLIVHGIKHIHPLLTKRLNVSYAGQKQS
jgi:hypothetical protein